MRQWQSSRVSLAGRPLVPTVVQRVGRTRGPVQTFGKYLLAGDPLDELLLGFRSSNAIRPSRPWILPRSFCERERSPGKSPARRVRAKCEAPDEKRRMRDLDVRRSGRRAATSARTRRKRLLLTRFHGMRCCREPFVAATQRRLRPRHQRVRSHALKQRQFARERHCFGRPDGVHACADRSDRQMHRA